MIFTQYNVDSQGRVALAYEIEKMIAKVANAPVFGFYDFNLRNGGIGGSVIPVEASGARVGRLALDILQGTSAAAFGTLQNNDNMPMFDWQQIRRWGGEPGRLPKDTVFLNRPPSVWQQYGTAIAGTLLFVLAQSVLIGVLLVNIRRRKRAEQVLGESEAKFHAIFDGILDSVVFTDTERRIRLINPAFTGAGELSGMPKTDKPISGTAMIASRASSRTLSGSTPGPPEKFKRFCGFIVASPSGGIGSRERPL